VIKSELDKGEDKLTCLAVSSVARTATTTDTQDNDDDEDDARNSNAQ